ncbi:hypothetical protein D3C80_1030200 [compost metagenome]
MYSPVPNCANRAEGRFCSAKAATTRCRSSASRPRGARKCCRSMGNRSPRCRCGNCPVRSRCRAWCTASNWQPVAPVTSSRCSTAASKAPAVSPGRACHCVASCRRTSRFWCATATRPRSFAANWPPVACAVCTCRTKTRYSRHKKPTTCWPGCVPAPSPTPSDRSRRRWPA